MSTKFSNRPVSEQSHEEHQAAGRMGGKGRGQQRRQHDDDDNMQSTKRSRSNSTSPNNKSGNNDKMSRQEAGRKGGLARSKNAGQYEQRGNDFDPESDKYGYDEGDDNSMADGIAAHTRSHDQDSNNNNDNDYNKQGEQDNQSGGRSNGKQAHSDFEQGKNPNRQAVSRRVARERGHEAFVEMGRKGGHANAGIHADLDFDDVESFRQHPEMGVPAKNPNRVKGGKQAAEKRGHDELSEMGRMGGEANAGGGKFGGAVDMGEDDNESFNERDLKSPNRVAGGVRAANKQSHESFVERGKMGAEARWGNTRQQGGQSNNRQQDEEDEDDEDDQQDDDSNTNGKDPVRVQAGKKAAQTRAENGTQNRSGSRPSGQQGRGNQGDRQSQGRQSQGRSQDDDEQDDVDMEDADDDNSGKDSTRVRAGKKAAETRARNGTQSHNGSRPSAGNANSRSGNNGSSQARNNQDDEENEDDVNDDNDMDDDNSGKDPTRVRAGKKAAETRARNGTQHQGGSRPSGGNLSSGNSRGGNNSRNSNARNSNQGKSFEIEEDDDNYDDINQDHFEDDNKNANRVRGGQKAASHFTHEELSERARRAAQTRAQNGTQSHNGSGIARNRQSQGRGSNDE